MKFGLLLWEAIFLNITTLQKEWNIETSSSGKNNNEIQRYDNTAFKFNNTELIITTINNNNNDIVSGRINTRNKIEFQYGYIETSILFSDAIGLWPAFWMLGNNLHWPACGEIDIFEWIAIKSNLIYGTLHGVNYNGGHAYGSGGINKLNTSLANKYHKYAIEWKPDYIKWYIDDILFFTASKHELEKKNKNYKWIFNDKYYFLLVNMAVGGNFGGSFRNSKNIIYKNLPYYNEMKIEYIKVYNTIDGYGNIKIY